MMTEHGTDAAYQRHRIDGSEPCAECRKARARYMAKYRARNPQAVAEDVARAAARTRALIRLARLHPTQFRALYREELDRQKVAAS